MLVLRDGKREPRWITLPDTDVSVLLPMPGAKAVLAATYMAQRAAFVAGDDPAQTHAAFLHAQCRSLAGHIQEWKGIVDEDGKALPISPEALDAFAAHPVAGPAFLVAYQSLRDEIWPPDHWVRAPVLSPRAQLEAISPPKPKKTGKPRTPRKPKGVQAEVPAEVPA